MSLRAYEDHLYQRHKFYDNALRRTRTDSDHPWSMEKNNKLGLPQFLAQFPSVRNTYRKLTGKPPAFPFDDYVRKNIEQLYEVRNLFADQLSQLLFDETVTLRSLSYGKFYFPRIDFDPIADIVSQETFSKDSFPGNYLQLALKQVEVVLHGKTGQSTVKIVTPLETIEMLNKYRQYFIQRGNLDFRPGAGDVVLDCGACIGDTSTIFSSFAGETGQVHLFDPIPLHIRFCKLQASLNPRLEKTFTFNQLAVGKQSSAHHGAKQDSNKIEPAGLQIDEFDMTSLDDYVSRNNMQTVDLIKMDVEGAETDALAGAASVIGNLKPRLAISTYHKLDDFWSIPLQIKALNPQYKFAFGHHTPTLGESVVYAYCD